MTLTEKKQRWKKALRRIIIKTAFLYHAHNEQLFNEQLPYIFIADSDR